MPDDPLESALYADRYCAFVDILGFRELIQRLDDGPDKFRALRTLLHKVHSNPGGKGQTEIRTESISDAVALSTEVSPGGLLSLFEALTALSIDLLIEGYFVRGAIVRGRLYHDDHMIFGAALVRAYTFESQIARYPRIVITEEVRNDIHKYIATADPGRPVPSMDALRPSADGPMFLDVLRPVGELLTQHQKVIHNLSEYQLAVSSTYLGIRDKIQERYAEAMDTPSHFEKVQWFARYWNSVVPNASHLRIRGAGLDEPRFPTI